ncbi:MAG: V-type ATPase subunit [Chitinivibrionales bacterium]
MAGALKKYAYINAKIRAKLGNILDESAFSSLSESGTVEEALSKLRDTEFSEMDTVYRKTGDLKFAELKLNETELSLYKEISDKLSGPPASVVKVLADKFMVENIKSGLRLFFEKYINKRDISGKVQYLLNAPGGGSSVTDALINSETIPEVEGVLKSNYYSLPAAEYIHNLNLEPSLFKAEISMDTNYYKTLINRISKLKGKDYKSASRITGVKIDILNMNTAIRLKKNFQLPADEINTFLIDGGFHIPLQVMKEYIGEDSINPLFRRLGTGDLSLYKENASVGSKLLLVEEALNNALKEEAHKILSGYPFTIGTVLAYFILKSDEFQKIRTVLNGINYGMDSKRIRDMI